MEGFHVEIEGDFGLFATGNDRQGPGTDSNGQVECGCCFDDQGEGGDALFSHELVRFAGIGEVGDGAAVDVPLEGILQVLAGQLRREPGDELHVTARFVVLAHVLFSPAQHGVDAVCFRQAEGFIQALGSEVGTRQAADVGQIAAVDVADQGVAVEQQPADCCIAQLTAWHAIEFGMGSFGFCGFHQQELRFNWFRC